MNKNELPGDMTIREYIALSKIELLELELKYKSAEVKMLRQGVALACAGFLLMWGIYVFGGSL